MSDASQFAGVLGGLAVLLFSAGLALRIERARLESRLRAFLGLPKVIVEGGATTRRPVTLRYRRRLLFRLLKIGAHPVELEQAGLYNITPARFLLFQLISAPMGYLLARVAISSYGIEGDVATLLLVVGTIGGLWLPRGVLWFLRWRRLNRFEKQFALAVDSIANALEAGLSLPQAIEMIGRDMPPPTGYEFNRVFREMGLGLSLLDALDGFAARVPTPDVDMFVSSINIQYRTGGNLSTILHKLAHTIRERIRIKGEIDVMTAQQRLSAIIVSLLPVGIFFLIRMMNPNYADKVTEPGTMRYLLLGAAVSVSAGFYVLMRMAKIEV